MGDISEHIQRYNAEGAELRYRSNKLNYGLVYGVRRKSTLKQRAEVKNKFLQGATPRELALEYNVSVGSIKNWVRVEY